MIRKMENYYDKKELCDVVLVAGRRRISAHRMVLSAASDYFAAMFTSDVREATEKEVTLKQIDPEALAALVDYAYTGKSKSLPSVDPEALAALVDYAYTGKSKSLPPLPAIDPEALAALVDYAYTGKSKSLPPPPPID